MTAPHALLLRRPGARAPLRASLALAALGALLATGCAAPPRVEYLGPVGVAHDGPDDDEPFDWPRPVRLGVVGGHFGRHLVLRDRVLEALDHGFDQVVHGYRPSRSAERVDYAVDVDVHVRGDAEATNFLVVLPGFAIFMPTWYPLRYGYEVTTLVRLWREDPSAPRRQPARTLTLTDRFEVRHTPPGLAVGAYIGWGAIVFPPLLLSPLVTGIVAAVDAWDPVHAAHLFAHDPRAGQLYGRRVARAVRAMVDAELRHE